MFLAVFLLIQLWPKGPQAHVYATVANHRPLGSMKYVLQSKRMDNFILALKLI